MPQNLDSPIGLPFRQTCDRCRQLKVRCKGVAPDSTLDTQSVAVSSCTAGLSCSRCVRAGANCTYSSKQRSGRPRVDKNQRRSSSSSVAILTALTPASTTNDSPEPFSWTSTSQESLSPSQQLFQANNPELAQFLIVDRPQCLGADSSSSAVSDAENIFHQGTDISNQIFDEIIPDLVSECGEPVQTLPQLQLPDIGLEADIIDDSVIRNTTELAELNNRIYHLQLQSQISEFPQARLCDDMTNVTDSLVEIIARLLERRNQRTAENCRQLSAIPDILMPPGATSHTTRDNVDYVHRRQSIRMSIYPDDDTDDIDISTVLLIMASYQRLCEFFKQTTLSMHAYIQTNGTSLSSRGQMVMTAELITYLIGRLDRVLSQLLTRRSLVKVTPMTPGVACQCHGMIDSDHLNSLRNGGRLHNARVRDGVHNPDVPNRGLPVSCLPVLSLIEHRMYELRMALQAHIAMIKQAVQDSDIM
ncbi:hypothetical protein NPX13_g7418 [Xylaria arbuscula]|uniref:Zn(2)-C6 fungal-type domain-containing protein n=1 Tax=Xylaria arbuscula TaxID=114810 RepID=A0A9W8NA19_9PEZI|nr:hypothetical protein NPX13_g7418 [Xylaria arbuscula]